MAQELEGQPAEQPNRIEVTWQGDVREACNSARQLAEAIGFPRTVGDEIVLAVQELATNLLKHASRGSIKLVSIAGAARPGIQIETEDRGPGIADVERALTDGYSTAGSLGIGLGAVNRLMDEFEIHSEPGAGTHIVCHRWLRPETSNLPAGELEFGAASRPRCDSPENGDAFVFRRWERFAIAGVIDGLGHGVFAQRAAQTGRQYIESHIDQPLDSLFRGVGRACRATRGVVMALARFDSSQQKVTLASIGNVEMRLFGSEQKFSPVVRRGIVGLNAPNPLCFDHPWSGGCVLVLHSDGLNAHWAAEDFPEILSETPAKAAHRLLAALGKPDDDATVIVVRTKRP